MKLQKFMEEMNNVSMGNPIHSIVYNFHETSIFAKSNTNFGHKQKSLFAEILVIGKNSIVLTSSTKGKVVSHLTKYNDDVNSEYIIGLLPKLNANSIVTLHYLSLKGVTMTYSKVLRRLTIKGVGRYAK